MPFVGNSPDGIDSETAKGMMMKYHVGTLEPSAKELLSLAEVSSEPRPIFLQTKKWSTAKLHAKKTLSWDSRIFTFQLDHPQQCLGLPVGHHLMIRLQDPASR